MLGVAEFWRQQTKHTRRPRKRIASSAHLLDCAQPPYQQGSPSCVPGAQDSEKLALSLESLSSLQDVWNKICWHSSGSSVVSMTQVSRSLRNATVRSPAFVFLAGRDADGFLVQWQDPANILAPRPIHRGWNPATHFRIRAGYQADEYDRMLQAQRTVEDFYNWRSDAHTVIYRSPLECHQQILVHLGFFPNGNYSYGAPARPPSACSNADVCNEYVYSLRNPCERVLSPAIFPPKAHKVENAKLLRRLYATPDDDTTSCESSYSTSTSDIDD